jgi:hypothetical protein
MYTWKRVHETLHALTAVGVEEKGFTVRSQVCSFFWERHVFVRMFGIAISVCS